MQKDHSVHLVLMVICSGAACVGPTVAFYYMAEMSALLYDPVPAIPSLTAPNDAI